MKMQIKFLSFLVIAALFVTCSSDPKSKSAGLPPASGMPGDVFVVMDSLQWRGPLGGVLDSIFNADMPGLPRKEARFKMRWIDPRKLNFVLRQSRNLVFVLTLDKHTEGSRIIKSFFTPESIQKIKTNDKLFSTTVEDIFSRGQEIMYLYGNDESALKKNIEANSERLTGFFDLKEKERLTRSLFKAGQVKGIEQVLQAEYQCNLKVPFGYKLADKQADFIWIRQINPRDDKDVFIARKPYTSPDAFSKKNLIIFRDDICRAHLFEDPDKPDTYLMTETTVPFIPVTADTINFNGHFAIRLRGIWRSNTFGMGGPLQGYALVDEGNQQFYYIEGFTFSPGKSQREIMRELETILHTFQMSQELPRK